MKLFVGLGNPGAKYEKTRHNVGFLAIEAIARAHGFPAERAKFQGWLAEGRLGAARVALIKPQTFMNLSGQCVGEALRYFKLEPRDVVAFHDELDLAPGRLKVKTGGGHAGHNGLRSLHEHIGAEFQRVRIGIGHPGDKRLVTNYVLHDFAKADWDWIDPLLDGIADGAPLLAADDASGFMNRVALKTNPPKLRPDKPKPDKLRPDKPKPLAPPSADAEHSAEPEQPSEAPKSAFARLAARFSRK